MIGEWFISFVVLFESYLFINNILTDFLPRNCTRQELRVRSTSRGKAKGSRVFNDSRNRLKPNRAMYELRAFWRH